MEVWVPCNTPTRQNRSSNSGFSLDPHNLTRCNTRNITMNELKTCFTEFLNIRDSQESMSAFYLSSNRNAIDNVMKKEDGHEDFNISSCSASEKLFNKYAAFTPPGELEVEELFGGKDISETDVTAELPEVNSSVKQSLTTPAKLVSAMKGNREKQGIPTKKLSVKWAPDVYDPVPTSVSHFPYNNQQFCSNGRRKNKQQKGGSKSLRGSKGKGKQQTRKNSANANKFKPL